MMGSEGGRREAQKKPQPPIRYEACLVLSYIPTLPHLLIPADKFAPLCSPKLLFNSFDSALTFYYRYYELKFCHARVFVGSWVV